MKDVQIELMKGIGSVGECINVKLKLFSALEEVNVYFYAEKRICSQTNVIMMFLCSYSGCKLSVVGKVKSNGKSLVV